MADSYCSAVFCIAVKDSKVATERMKLLECFILNGGSLPENLFAGKTEFVREKLVGHHEGMGFAWSIEKDSRILCLYHQDTMDLEQAVTVAQIMLELDESPHIYVVEWADTCSKARSGEFGGGAIAFTSRRAKWMSTREVASNLERDLAAEIEKEGLVTQQLTFEKSW